ncbi:DNA-binding transcriptional ArsR family regulator [Streptosporangium becharense]|uniref:DNA-binding transcriptional ArsR family regulator n=1 Tax=Streptosporangium becharense TaxID=1816182 RepID=A0A7W9IM52_9ACTN|nr:helix-turn-helix domain-containing protein [Streptosporangium becharense]MBB2910532.1 DNA-binding transcriptional ArsR family regulator [Streptosporangium becharense]MBB5823275.1 DNA-binding transcriptional ArsR family regulator [Streptosporangium becharense]
MTTAPHTSLAATAALLADGTRARFCLALLDGRAWTAAELAAHAGVTASTASEHLSRLVEGGILAEERQGRHRYVRLAGPEVAELIEDLAGHAAAGDTAARPATLRAHGAARAMAAARTCYDHLAGRLGVAVADALAARGLLLRDAGFALSGAGLAWFETDLGVRPAARGRRPLVRPCLDWTERRHHLGGTAGAVLCAVFLERGWVVRIGSGRALRVTESGDRALHALLGVVLDPAVA